MVVPVRVMAEQEAMLAAAEDRAAAATVEAETHRAPEAQGMVGAVRLWAAMADLRALTDRPQQGEPEAQ